jgi:hypothetical protein
MKEMNKRYGIIIGAMKSGTSALFGYLSQHPEVCPSFPKEPRFFVEDTLYQKGIDAYQDFWNWDPDRHMIAVEASTSYTKMPVFPNAAERIKSSGIRAKFIYIMRNPVDRIESQLRHSLARGWTALNDDGSIHEQLICASRYHAQIREYFTRFDKKDILLLHFEDLRDDPRKIMKEVCAFLEIDPGFRFNFRNPDINDGTPYAMMNLRIFKRINSLGVRLNLLNIWNFYLRRNRLIAGWISHSAKRSDRLSEEQRAEILAIIGDDLLRLRDEFSFDISRWNLVQ